MPALYTDKLRKKKSMFISNITSGIGSTDTVIACESLAGLPTDTAVTLTIDRVDENGARLYSQVERVTGIVSGDNLIDCLRGQDNTTARAHNAGAVLEDIWDASTWNNTIDWALVQHNQDGTHKDFSLDTNTDFITEHNANGTHKENLLTFVEDTTNTNDYEGTILNANSITSGFKINLKITNACTGPSTLNINTLGSKSIKKNVVDDLEADDIKAGQVVPLVYDGTNFQIVGGGGGTAGGADVLSVQVFS